jgi:hypothetical protein
MNREGVKHELAILVLWLLAVVPTFLLLRELGLFTYLGPLYFLCMVGSVYIVRSAKKSNK